MRRYTKQTTKALLIGALAFGTGAAVADEPERLYQNEAAEEAGDVVADDLKDDKLHGFIDAAHEIVSIREEFASRIEEAEADERPALQAEATEHMAKAIEDNGLAIEEYREIGYLLENEDELSNRLDALAARQS